MQHGMASLLASLVAYSFTTCFRVEPKTPNTRKTCKIPLHFQTSHAFTEKLDSDRKLPCIAGLDK